MALSPLTALLLGVLAYRTYQGKGRLADMFGPASAPPGSAPPGALPGDPRDPRAPQRPATGGGLGDLLRGNLGGLLAGGAAGGLLGSGLNDLLGRFQRNGFGDVADSWIGTGPNREISPQQLQQALGPDTVNSLAEQAGVSDVDLLSGLSRDLPDAVDQLTPSGEIPRD